MINAQNLFDGQEVTFVVENDADLVFCQREFRLPAVKLDDIKNMAVRPTDVTQNLLVICETEDEGIEKLADLMAQGCDAADLRFIDIGLGGTLAKSNPQQLLARLARPKDIYWRTTRSIRDWGDYAPLTTFETHIEHLSARWAFPSVAVFCGGYGSGKSTIAQMFGLKLAHHNRWPIHVCAWEDRRDNFQGRLWRTAVGYSPREAIEHGIDHRPAMDLEGRVFWDEPDKIDERALSGYFERVRYFHRSHGVKVFVCDPWNEFDHDNSPGERETLYIRRMMREAQAMTRELGIIFMIVTHLPKGGYSDDGSVKPFRIANAAGSAEFGNKASYGFCIARSSIFAEMLRGDESLDQKNRDLGLAIASEFGPPKGDQHVVVSVDKIKIEGEMGHPGVFAYVLDKQRNDLIFDPAATKIAQIMWRA